MKKTFAEWVLALTRGYIKVTGKKPDKLSQLKINMEAGQKVRDQEKVIKVDFNKNKPWHKEKEIDWDKVNKIDIEDFAGGGIAGMLGEPTYVDDNHRVPFGAGGFNAARRLFLQMMGAGAAGVGAAKTGLFGLLKGSKSAAVKDLTSVPIQNAEGMPSWFKPLVNRVIKEGKDISKLPVNEGGAFAERQIIHSKKLGENHRVNVIQDVDNQTIRVEYQSADNMGGIDDSVNLEYKAAEEVEPMLAQHMNPKDPKGPWLPNKAQKTKPTFEASEAYPLQDPKDYKTITFESDNTVKNVDDLFSDTNALKEYATGKVSSAKELHKSIQKKRNVKKINDNPSEELAGSGPDYDDFASGGRVPFSKGKRALEGLAKLMDEFFPGTTKLGQRSKPFPGKVQETMDLRKALARFIEAEKAAKLKKLKTWEDPDKVRAAVDDIFSTGDYKMDAQMAAEALVENNPKAFGNKLFDDLDDKTRSDIYGAVVNVVQRDLAKALQLKRASRPEKTLKGIEETGTIDMSDDAVAAEFTRFMKETDPKGYAKIQKVVDDANQQLELKRFKTKDRKPNASGGLAGMLGE